LAREAKVIQAITKVGIPTPRFVGYEPTAQVLVLERIDGRGDFHNLADQAHRDRIADRFVEVLADLHRHEPSQFGLDGVMAMPLTAEQHALGELEIAERLSNAVELNPEPILSFARRWLRRNVPARIERTCFIQGDTGPGNFVFDDKDVWLVDLEIAHFGDPMEDLAAVCIRDMVTPFGDLRRLFRRYGELTDWPLNLDRVRYHRVSKCVRSLMAIVSLAEHGNQRGELLTWWSYRALYIRGACQALAEAIGIDFATLRDPTPQSRSGSKTAWTALHELLALDLDDLAAANHTPPLMRVIARDQTLAAVLRNADWFGPTFLAAENAELGRLLGHDVIDNESGLRELDNAIHTDTLTADDIQVLRFLTARADRQCILMRPAMGPMADGRFSPMA
jgi:aminoglycoside phosphotransferase (APT) family kinase protein